MAFSEDIEKDASPSAGQTSFPTSPTSPTSAGGLFSEEKNSTDFSRPPSASSSNSDTDNAFPTTNNAATHRISHAPSATPSTKPADMPLPKEILFITVVASAQLMTQAGMSQSMAPLHIMAQDFGSPSAGQLSWFTAAYSLTVGTFILIAGRLGDMFGHKPLFVFGWFWYGLWSLVAGLTVYSGSQVLLDVCRALQGAGPAILLPSSLAILGSTYPPGRRKEMVFSVYAATAPNGFIVGALFSSLFAQYAWWPWTYWVAAIVCAVYGVLAWFVVPADEPHEAHVDAAGAVVRQTFDYLGAVTGVVGLVLFNVAWNQAPVVGWDAPYVVVLLVLGVLFFLAFIFVEKKVQQPLVPINSLDAHAGFVLACMAFGWSSFGIWIYYFWQFTIVLQHDTPLSVVAQNLPCGISGACAAITVGFLLSRVKTAWLMLGSMVAFCCGNIILATLPVGRLFWKQVFWSVIITPWGMDMSFPAATIILSNHVPKRHQGIAASLVTTVVNYSISWGLGIAGTVEVHVNNGGENILAGYRGAWYSGIGLAGLGIIIAMLFVFSSYRSEARKNADQASEKS
ncbi:yor378w-like protein [Diplodia corticola]|uniref:Yor378w-like protein n=1 Tax=Diplodia corticola TaxID=236234 RepID=A0A1J9R8L4_9PEZI|nr:yor378w-like protein [Diplodia corticola]OJD36920.1 yor378w-like protein [Diplodia corticola]